jgi:hypothetical protein
LNHQDFSASALSQSFELAVAAILGMLEEPTMKCELLSEFEEMEGLAKEHLIDGEIEIIEDEIIDNDTSSKPTAASTLSSSDIYYEVLCTFEQQD